MVKKMQKQTQEKWGRALALMMACLLVFLTCPGMQAQAKAKAKKPTTQTAVLRIISTTDLHGQVSTMHYDSASVKTGSLAQAYTLIKQARKEVGKNNTMTVDIGDSVYGYAADYILDHSGENSIQPIYKAMMQVDYDAVTLGNHDFDYGYEYIDKQLSLSGLKSKCIVANIIKTDTGRAVWDTRKIITKKVKTNKGKYVNVSIGIVGVTYPAMSTYSDCKENLASLPVVKTVEKEAAVLKAQGVDLVVVLAHTSFGKANPSDTDNNVTYALTKLKNVDAVAAGHGHKNFPSADEASNMYYNLPNVDRQTGLMNGKPVTMVKDHGAGIGLIDLKLKITSSGSISISNAAASVRSVTKDTASSQAVLAAQKSEIQPVDQSLEEVVGTLAANEKINSYFALLEDNYAIQLVNESKLQYGLAYTGGAGKKLYADYPVVAATPYMLSNSQSANDQINLNGSITMKDILNMQQDNHNNNILYWVTGSQLREMLEWSASIYNTMNGRITSDEKLSQLLKEHGAESIVASDWLDDWSNFAVYDGIEYTIDTTKAPRYTKSGKLKNSYAHRIVNLTYNGQPVSEDQKFILVCHTVASVDAAGTIENQKVLGKADYAYEHLAEYIKQQVKFGDITSYTDYNWNVIFEAGRNYIVRSSILSQPEAEMREWFSGLVGSNETFAYYLAQFIQKEEADTTSPMLVVSSTLTEETDTPIAVKVQANDRSGIWRLKWQPGQVDAQDSSWINADIISGGSFTVDTNGVYSVLAEDYFDNRTVKYIDISNINADVLLAPTIKKMSNRGSAVSGTAKPGTVVHIEAAGNTYEAVAEEDGTYTCTVERMDAGEMVTAYCTDENGKKSKTVSTKVVRSGPNVPYINQVSNKTVKVTGSYSDTTSALAAIVGSDVYCSGTDGKEIYQRSELYSETRVTRTADYVQSGKDFEFYVPVQDAGTAIKFVALDKAGRRSAAVTVQTAEEAPDVPDVYEVCNVEDHLYGKVTSVHEQGMVTAEYDGKQFTGEIQEDGSFDIQTDGYTLGQSISIVASDYKDGEARISLPAAVKVASFADYVNANDITVEPIYNNAAQIKGQTVSGSLVSLWIRGKSVKAELDSVGQFAYTLAEPLQAGERIYIVSRSADGSIAGISPQTVLDYANVVVTPQAPSVLNSEITYDTAWLEVLAKEQGTIVMEIGGTQYTSGAGVYNQAYDGYIYTLALLPTQEDQEISVYFINEQGVSSSMVTVMRTNNGI